eukprot:CAMPEP_0117457812 /NCGR_PEP_ID=MMETSP0784-20121206/605_1 /TAXON_ID=39447 /ORGANISM="" /LENGTH=159 /DNA_ID=CAMNT_0005251305 /DNA_START=25 /DNA_END=505 /DNA_ORIENTATION=-
MVHRRWSGILVRAATAGGVSIELREAVLRVWQCPESLLHFLDHNEVLVDLALHCFEAPPQFFLPRSNLLNHQLETFARELELTFGVHAANLAIAARDRRALSLNIPLEAVLGVAAVACPHERVEWSAGLRPVHRRIGRGLHRRGLHVPLSSVVGSNPES